ncbi:MAG TPA: hypothetical protein VED46_02050 [Alphaproteobacteria bacterium]|nr:hypothetical protein [Alphaproteobacteria bacterium]
MIDLVLGGSWPVFIGVTLILFGGAAFLMGQALGETWRPLWQVVLYSGLLGVADRLLGFLLFGRDLLSVPGYLFDAAVLVAMALVAYRLTRVNKMVNQYPWLFERAGLFGWRDRKAQ